MSWGGWVMRFKTSLFNKGLFFSDLKRFWWVSFLYAIVLFFNLPFNHLMLGSREMDEWQVKMLQRSLDFSGGANELQILLILVVPVVLATLLFKYLMTARSTAMMHSLPFTKKALFITHSSAGLFLLVIPVIFTAIVMMVLQAVTFLQQYYTLINVLTWLGYTLLFSLLVYAAAVFVGMFTGNSIAHIVFNYIFHILPLGLFFLINFTLKQMLYGYPYLDIRGSFLENLPIVMLVDGRINGAFTAGHIAGYLFGTVVLFVLAYYLYKIRKAEAAGDLVAFPIIRPVFKYGVTFSFMLLGGVYFSEISQGDFTIMMLGYVISSLLGYWIAEVLVQRSLKVWGAYKGYLLYAAIVIVAIGVITADVTGYERRVPAPDQVEKVYLAPGLYAWINRDEKSVDISNGQEITYYSTAYMSGLYQFQTAENIEKMTMLHKQLTEDPHKMEGPQRYIIYSLKNGKTMIRQYPIDEKHYARELKPIYESMEYKQARFPVLTQDLAEIKMIEIDDDRTPKEGALLVDNAQIAEFIEALRQDIVEATFEDLIRNNRNYVSIEITSTKEKSYHYVLDENYRHVIDWLKNENLYDKTILLPEEIESASLEKEIILKDDGRTVIYAPERKKVEINDPEVIKELLNASAAYQYKRGSEPLIVIFSMTGGFGRHQFSANINDDIIVSEKLRGYINQLNSM
jgi:ABC-2 type transport system permease protein